MLDQPIFPKKYGKTQFKTYTQTEQKSTHYLITEKINHSHISHRKHLSTSSNFTNMPENLQSSIQSRQNRYRQHIPTDQSNSNSISQSHNNKQTITKSQTIKQRVTYLYSSYLWNSLQSPCSLLAMITKAKTEKIKPKPRKTKEPRFTNSALFHLGMTFETPPAAPVWFSTSVAGGGGDGWAVTWASFSGLEFSVFIDLCIEKWAFVGVFVSSFVTSLGCSVLEIIEKKFFWDLFLFTWWNLIGCELW